MHLKSLTVKGFKSFANATTLRLEPGITCVVGPNGSGKSNVVDAIAWVLGEQGAKSLRGGKMEDVIFAGTTGRAALGRAEVTLTIDNTDGALPIDYTEVSITRRLFRTGESEYEINGDSCRLLDIQELLSDSGIGRELHVIVGQGQLDTVLHANPEHRRAFIEEAAGVLKHRKRKEKALRKLDAMLANLTRIGDLATELRRQLKPLGKQAEIARRAAGIQADLRDSRLRLLADDLATLRGTLHREVADETALRERREVVEASYAESSAELAELENALAADAPALARAQETWYRLSALQERLRSTAQLAAEKLRYLSTEPADERAGRDPEQLEAEAQKIREQENGLREALEEDEERLKESVFARQELEVRLREAERALVTAAKAVADRREGLAKLSGQVGAVRSRVAAAAEELTRLSTALNEARTRAEDAAVALAEAQGEGEAVDEGGADLDVRHADAKQAADLVTARIKELTDAERAAEREVSGWKARAEALELGLRRKDAAGALLAAAGRSPGVLGSVASLLTVDSGYEAALAAALGGLADAVAVDSVDAATAAITMLKADDAGRASLLVAAGGRLPGAAGDGGRAGDGVVAAAGAAGAAGSGGQVAGVAGGRPALPSGARWALDVVRAPGNLADSVAAVLRGFVFVPDLAAARALLADHPGLTAVTTDGDVLAAGQAAGGSAKAPSLLEVQAAVDEAKLRKAEFEERAGELADQLEIAREELAVRREAVTAVANLRREADAQRNAVQRRLAELGAAARSAQSEVDRYKASWEKAEAARERDLAGLAELEERLQAAEDLPVDEDPSTEERDYLASAAQAARQGEMEVRLAVRTAEERVLALSGRAEGLARQARQERAAREKAAERRAARERAARVAHAVSLGAGIALDRISGSLSVATAEREEASTAKAQREQALVGVRARVRELSGELERLTSQVHRDEVARAEQRLRIEQLEAKAVEDYSIEPTVLLDEYGPQALIPVEDGDPVRFERAVQEKRAARGERELALLGKVNPLALEEFAALEERYKFLSDQLEDLKATRRDLLTVVKEVDDRILEVFRDAYEDTAREFQIVFQTLFPGGEGRLVLTDPDNLLLTGVEVEARPPGKKVKRLSLLSGGERSLTAVALLCAIFRARPSPFYIMDEVEAALDDVNLGRLLDVMKLLQDNSQLIVITHQKRTMEIADALYGVTMRGGVSQVISQKLKEA
ncbi:chromosome partition protein Smc [Longispora fulva]|uniref:Chromosome partition protein Smc n=1 Tax=Longispora fulva TaxID=619741 RepID=A0A8J7GXQ6_9ACTN|nr:AAA family ATPase [Longispora fulva]MBG6141074.1 chromosome segregation protein [Longispora fulva]GIG60657.1 chromosome partition protein Smc [Longispora fulva]